MSVNKLKAFLIRSSRDKIIYLFLAGSFLLRYVCVKNVSCKPAMGFLCCKDYFIKLCNKKRISDRAWKRTEWLKGMTVVLFKEVSFGFPDGAQ